MDDLSTPLYLDLVKTKLKNSIQKSLLSARDRQKDVTSKAPTGEFDRRRLLDYMTEEAKSSTVGADYIPFEKKSRGKAYKPRPKPELSVKAQTKDMDEIDRLLADMSSEDIGDLALSIDCDEGDGSQPWTGLKKIKVPVRGRTGSVGTGFSYIMNDEVTGVNPDEIIERVSENDPSLKEVILNNNTRVDSGMRSDLLTALHKNSHVEKLLANIKFDDDDAKVLAKILEQNKVIRVLNLESNRITATGVRVLIKSLLKNQTVQEFRVENQDGDGSGKVS
eukprot:m.274034 g.274034  ORF g.274034 m.274034 type:complete len:278 (+) comp40582_c0_seq6:89-922(+)